MDLSNLLTCLSSETLAKFALELAEQLRWEDARDSWQIVRDHERGELRVVKKLGRTAVCCTNWRQEMIEDALDQIREEMEKRPPMA